VYLCLKSNVKILKVSQRHVVRLLQTVFFSLALVFLWFQLADVDPGNWKQLGLSVLNNPYWLALIVAFTILNWWLESKKWQLLSEDFHSMSTAVSARAVLGGTYLSLFTPNRLGDLAGRIYLTPAGKRSKAASTSAFGSLTQLTVTLVAGLIAVALLLFEKRGFEPLLIVTPLLLAAFFLIAFFRMDILWKNLLSKFSSRWSWLKRFHFDFSARKSHLALWLSLARYAVFSTQFLILLHLFGIDLPLWQAFAGIATTYLISSVVPASILGELGVRESVAIFIFGWLGQEAHPVFASTFTLWFFNLILPATLGGFFISSASARFIRQRS